MIAITVLGVGATLVHVVDIIQHGNLAPGNTLQNVSNLAKPALLIGFLRASGRADTGDWSLATPPSFVAWQTNHIQIAEWLAFTVSSGFGIGYAFDRSLLGTVIGLIVGVVASIPLYLRIT